MQVKLISMTNDPIDVMWTAARTCYSSKGPIEIFDNRYLDMMGVQWTNMNKEKEIKMWNLVKKVLDSGHQSIAEHVYFTFAIEGISRACSHQLVRHRAGIVFSQQSQRYVEIKEDFQTIYDLLHAVSPARVKDDLISICEKYFVDVNDNNYYSYAYCLLDYLKSVKAGIKPEDARNILPNATKTNITMSVNLRELIHMCNLRLCTRAQKEIRDLFTLIKKQVEQVQPELATYLVPQCEINDICFEDKCCGRKPTIKEVKLIYNKFKNRSEGMLTLMHSK